MHLKTLTLAVASMAVAVFGLLVVAELVLWLLPVSTGVLVDAVTRENPIVRYVPNQEFTFSDEWNFAIVNRGRVNNAGFVNDQDYANDPSRPLLAVIGDSYIEALMVPYSKTIQGRLQDEFGERVRVYSFGISGSPLSQYLAVAEYVRKRYHPQMFLFNIVVNDFDKSLEKYSEYDHFALFTADEEGI